MLEWLETIRFAASALGLLASLAVETHVLIVVT